MKRGKKYQDAVKAYDRSAQYDVAEAIDLVKKNATAKFDETIEGFIFPEQFFGWPDLICSMK